LLKNNLSKIFSNIEAILEVHLFFILELEEKMKTWCPSTQLGNLFIEKSSLLHNYTEYITNYNTSLQVLEKLRKKSVFNSFLEDAKKHPRCQRLGLAGLLIMPVQRIPRYELLLRDYIKHTWRDHQDYAALGTAIQSIQQVNKYINDKKKESDLKHRMEEVQEKLKGNRENLLQTHRRFIMEGAMKDLDSGEDRHFFLFNDILMSTSRKKALLKNTFLYNYQYSIQLDDAEVIDVPDSGTVKHALQLKVGSKGYLLCCTSREEKLSWLTSLNKTITSHNTLKGQLIKLIGKEGIDWKSEKFFEADTVEQNE